MRALLIDEASKAEVKRVREFAEKPENYFKVGADGFSFQRPPGDDPRHVMEFRVGFRTVFSITRSNQGLYRHISISVPSNYPNPIAAFTIAEEFGFTGWNGTAVIPPPRGWMVNIDKVAHCCVLAQELP